jgi:hypothetical protein
MNCDQCLEYLDEYTDGTLDSEQRERVELHLGECSVCKANLEELEELLNSARKLRRELEPSRNLWPLIADRIEPKPVDWSGRRAPRPEAMQWLQLAAVLGLLVVGLWTAQSHLRPDPSSPSTETAESTSSVTPKYSDHADRARSEDGIMLAKIDLLRTIEHRRGILDDQTLQQIEADMILLEESIGEIRLALAQQPDNRKLKLALAARYLQGMRFLQQVSRV